VLPISEEKVIVLAKRDPVLIEETVSDEFNVIVFAVMVLPVSVENVIAFTDRSPVLIEETINDEFNVIVFAVMVLPVSVENVIAFTDRSPVLIEETINDEFNVIVFAVMVLPIRVETLIVCTVNVDKITTGVEIRKAFVAFTLILSALKFNVPAFIVIVCDGSRLFVIGTMVEIDNV
jgi:hypothetical protein